MQECQRKNLVRLNSFIAVPVEWCMHDYYTVNYDVCTGSTG